MNDMVTLNSAIDLQNATGSKRVKTIVVTPFQVVWNILRQPSKKSDLVIDIHKCEGLAVNMIEGEHSEHHILLLVKG